MSDGSVLRQMLGLRARLLRGAWVHASALRAVGSPEAATIAEEIERDVVKADAELEQMLVKLQRLDELSGPMGAGGISGPNEATAREVFTGRFEPGASGGANPKN